MTNEEHRRACSFNLPAYVFGSRPVVRLVIAEYKCGCSWVGQRNECLEYCQYHGDDRRRMYPANTVDGLKEGWSR